MMEREKIIKQQQKTNWTAEANSNKTEKEKSISF